MTVCYCSRLNINVLRLNFTLAVIFFAFFEYVLYDCIPKDCRFGLKIS